MSVGACLNDQSSFQSDYYQKYNSNNGDDDDDLYIPHTKIISAEGNASLMAVDKVAYFSSKGPTADGRLKPDIIAPGWSVVSSEGGATCSVKKMRGTSMATPIASGAALAIREYFMQGHYPTGTKNSKNAFIPSGALLKAMMIHSAQPMSSTVNNNGAVTPISGNPSFYSGFGRIQLDKVCTFL
jgi:hypothetical protein